MASLGGGFEAAVAGCDEAVYVGCELMELIKIYKRCTSIRDRFVCYRICCIFVSK